MGGAPLPVDEPDDGLVRRAAGGDVSAFARLIRVHHEELTRVALVVSLDLAAAAYAVHEAWPEAWSGLASVTDEQPFLPWAAGLVADEAVRFAARTSRPPLAPGYVLEDPDDPRDPREGEGPAGVRGPADVGEPDGPDGIGPRLGALSLRDRALVALHVLAGYEAADLARREHRPVAESRARLDRLLRDLSGADAVRRWANRPVRPVDADRTARWARSEAVLERRRRWSVAVAAVGALFVAGIPYIARLLSGR